MASVNIGDVVDGFGRLLILAQSQEGFDNFKAVIGRMSDMQVSQVYTRAHLLGIDYGSLVLANEHWASSRPQLEVEALRNTMARRNIRLVMYDDDTVIIVGEELHRDGNKKHSVG